MSDRDKIAQTRTSGRSAFIFRNTFLQMARWAVAASYPWPRSKRLKNGLKLIIDPKSGWIDFNLAVRSEYESGTLKLIEGILPSGGLFIDIGANIGVMSTFAARHVGHSGVVLAFEPDHLNFARLTWAREANKLPQLFPIPIALGNKGAMMPLRRSPTGDGGLTSLAHVEGFQQHAAVLVASLDELSSALPISKIDLIKIDVEGFEDMVIDGAIQSLKTHTPFIIMEMVNENAVKAGKKLVSLGYEGFLAGDKSNENIGTLERSEPRALIHNNMLFSHRAKTCELALCGLL